MLYYLVTLEHRNHSTFHLRYFSLFCVFIDVGLIAHRVLYFIFIYHIILTMIVAVITRNNRISSDIYRVGHKKPSPYIILFNMLLHLFIWTNDTPYKLRVCSAHIDAKT